MNIYLILTNKDLTTYSYTNTWRPSVALANAMSFLLGSYAVFAESAREV